MTAAWRNTEYGLLKYLSVTYLGPLVKSPQRSPLFGRFACVSSSCVRRIHAADSMQQASQIENGAAS